jgi:hypothetical protein
LTELIEYELHLPGDRTGDKLRKTIVRILKHTYRAKRVRVQQAKGEQIITCQVDRFNLPAIRGAVSMTMMARGIQGKLHRGEADDSREKSDPDKELRPAG